MLSRNEVGNIIKTCEGAPHLRWPAKGLLRKHIECARNIKDDWCTFRQWCRFCNAQVVADEYWIGDQAEPHKDGCLGERTRAMLNAWERDDGQA